MARHGGERPARRRRYLRRKPSGGAQAGGLAGPLQTAGPGAPGLAGGHHEPAGHHGDQPGSVLPVARTEGAGCGDGHLSVRPDAGIFLPLWPQRLYRASGSDAVVGGGTLYCRVAPTAGAPWGHAGSVRAEAVRWRPDPAALRGRGPQPCHRGGARTCSPGPVRRSRRSGRRARLPRQPSQGRPSAGRGGCHPVSWPGGVPSATYRLRSRPADAVVAVAKDRAVKAVVIGASAGLGRALASCLAEAGHELVLVARDGRDLDAVARDLAIRFGRPVGWIAADLGNPDAAALKTGVLERLGGIDALFVVAGLGDDADCGPLPDGALRRLIEVNYAGPLSLINAFLPDLTRAAPAHLVGVGSVAAIRGRSRNMVYGSAKRGLEFYFEALRHYLADTGCRVQFYRAGFM
ncbi:MAG: SDR family oxidoreductase, partial [Magnetospirillum sp.]